MRTWLKSDTGRWLVWFFLGFVAALWLQWTQANAFGGDWTGLIATSDSSPLAPAIERELGPVYRSSPNGHDGQYSFLVAVDPLAKRDAVELFDSAPYRYRRILYPLLAGGFGQFSGDGTLAGLVVLAAAGFGAAAASLASLSTVWRLPRWIVLGVFANPGLWLSLRLLTADALALGLALSGLLLLLKKRTGWAIVLFGLAALTKDQYLLVAASAAGWMWFSRHQKVHATMLMVGATLPLAAWVAYLTAAVGDGATVRGNFHVLGFLDAVAAWPLTPVSDQILVYLTLTAVLLAGAAAIRAPLLMRWLSLPWVVLALVTSDWVWNVGNNAARVFAPLWVFALPALAAMMSPRQAADS